MSVVVKLEEFRFVDGSDSELSLDGRDERWTLEESAGEGVDGLWEFLDVIEGIVQPQDGHILLPGTLLRLDETGSSVNADDQTAGNLWVEGSRVTCLLDSENSPDPCDDFVRGWVGWLVEVDDTGADIRLEVTLKWRATVWDWGEV